MIASIAAMVLGILLIANVPDDSIYLNSIYYGEAEKHDKLCVTQFYPVGVLGNEKQNGIEYTYYIASTRDISNTDYLFVVKTSNKDVEKLLEAKTPTPYNATLYGKACQMQEQIKNDFDELIAEKNLDDNYKIAQWYFEDCLRNEESESAICIICGFTSIIISFAVMYIFFRKITKKPQINN